MSAQPQPHPICSTFGFKSDNGRPYFTLVSLLPYGNEQYKYINPHQTSQHNVFVVYFYSYLIILSLNVVPENYNPKSRCRRCYYIVLATSLLSITVNGNLSISVISVFTNFDTSYCVKQCLSV